MPNPSAGSANPAASLSALWGYIQPALDHIVRSPTNTPAKAPAVSVEYHVGIHTAVYNYFTTLSDPVALPQSSTSTTTTTTASAKGKNPATSGTDLYSQLDKYYEDTCRELLAGCPPDDDTTLIAYLVPCFHRFSAGAASVNRLLNYVNRHYVKRAVEEDRGWLRVADVLDVVARTIKDTDTRENIAKRLREQRKEELRKWGYEDAAGDEAIAKAEAGAEAASALDRIVPLQSLAHRRFRTEILDPLLAVPKAKGKHKPKGKKKPPLPSPPTSTSASTSSSIEKPQPPGPGPGPKGRLARAVKDLIESKDGDEERRRKLARDMDFAMGTAGIKLDHPLRKKLDKFASAVSLPKD
ncbi:hypothetical protein BD410DRAFT_738770 [Rickenella mellea]|uniref:Uncharacterized protein n=1 Tax=Rickenella mellea TaxID=50990 RepID=A0A4Y7QNF6_9AGAM|nr:hypothetical protein BD410DRAFT_738770 [Rickenella mellea]